MGVGRGSVGVLLGAGVLHACSSFTAAEPPDPGADATTPLDAAVDAADAAVIGTDAGVFARDTFERTETVGFGTADVGGRWFTSLSSHVASVGMGMAHFTVQKSGQNGRAYLTDVMARDVDLHVVVHYGKIVAGSGIYVSLHARGTANTDRYYAGVVARAGAGRSTLSVGLGRPIGIAATVRKSGILPNVDVTAGGALEMRAQIYGTSPTVIRERVWPVGSPEPTDWQITFSDDTNALEAPGAVGIETYTDPSDAGAEPFDVTLDDFAVTAPPAN